MFRHKTYKRIRYADTDKMGYLYYGNYAVLYEIGRSEMVRDIGLPYQRMEDEMKIMMPVVAISSRYRLPLYYDEKAAIVTILKDMPGKLITFHHEIYNEEKELCHTAEVKLFFVDMETGKRVSAPRDLTQKLEPYFEQ